MNMRTGKSTDQPKTRVNRHIGLLRRAMTVAIRNEDAKTARLIALDIQRLEGWTATAVTTETPVAESSLADLIATMNS
jgi:hypothetical protein